MKQQQGIALITILVMVALATILAATIAKRQANTAENTAYLMRQNQSLLYAKSAEAFFSELLVDDAENAGDIDHLQENWAKPMPAFPVEDGFVSGTLQDESGKFNLNSLVNNDGTPNPQSKAWFEKLLLRVGLPEKLSEAVIDWQDTDDETIGAMGAEASYYQGLPQGYLAPNSKFHSVEELKLVRGFEGQKYLQIADYVSAAPTSESKVNVNTASAMLLASLDPKLDVNAIEQILQQRQANLEYFSNINDLWVIEPFAQVNTDVRNEVNDLLGVQSSYFKAKIEVLLSERKRQFSSDLVRKDKTVYVAYRSMAPF
ncbi:type II secretion system minor pseudopilin GspK [Acinetobacter sp. ANC 5380]|jgi:general secretion pathway protein K|uniref:Type II secretion system protein K n=1 Tax=Acinetobacter terrae TaxID=2731247 RepID=A0A7Y2RFM9_9GAMM|nr:type II secretion system minor pseudopilin GspK [Acinetobacter terrae]NNH16150.1 type II secretion system minor pseudopilin GspK [Acinetobacter terrae]NNH77923.1 type II secretion system minor pseudopilin GspK [Acinetobacter terrae]